MIWRAVGRALSLALLVGGQAWCAGALKPVVMLDPGHGGAERGVKAEGMDEAAYTLALAQKVAEALKKAGIDARLTRDQDVTLSPQSRTAMATAANAAALVSLHINHSYNHEARGLRVFVPGPGPVDEPAAPLWEQASRLQALPSKALGQSIAAALGETGGRSVQSLKLALFRGLAVPAAEVELDYASNSAAWDSLRKAENQDVIAAKLALGIAKFVQASPGTALGSSDAPAKP